MHDEQVARSNQLPHSQGLCFPRAVLPKRFATWFAARRRVGYLWCRRPDVPSDSLLICSSMRTAAARSPSSLLFTLFFSGFTLSPTVLSTVGSACWVLSVSILGSCAGVAPPLVPVPCAWAK